MHPSRMRTAHSSSHQLGGCLPQCMLGYPRGVGLETPLGVGLKTPEVLAWRPSQMWAWRPPGQTPQLPLWCGPGDHPPRPDPSTFPLVWGLETPLPGQTPQFPPPLGVGLVTCKALSHFIMFLYTSNDYKS